MLDDVSDFTIGEIKDADAAFQKLRNLWGCRQAWHNVCEAEIQSSTGKLRLFLHLRYAINQWVDSLDRKSVGTCEHLIRLSSAEGDLHTYVLLCSACYNPKVQTYVRCGSRDPEFALDDKGFATMEPATPWVVELLTSTCRLCCGSAAPDARSVSIHFETSDEVARRLLERSSWTLTKLAYKEDTTSRSLRRMIITGTIGEARALRLEKDRKVSARDIFMDFNQLPKGSAIQQGAAEGEALAIDEASRGSDRDIMRDDVEGEDERGDASFSACFEEMVGDVVAFAGVGNDALHEVMLDFLGEQADDFDKEDDAEDLGAAEPAADDDMRGGGEGDEIAEVLTEVVDMVELAHEAFAPAPPAGPPDDPVALPVEGPHPPPLAHAEVPPPDAPVFEISELGYVTSSRPPFGPNTRLGLVGYRGDNTSIYANCHMHPKCSVSAGIRVRPVSREWMASWLARGVPIDTKAPMVDRLAEGQRHRALWAKPLL